MFVSSVNLISFYLVSTFFQLWCLAGNFDWQKYMPDTCADDLNYSLPPKPITMNVSIWVNAIYEISESKMEFGTQIDLLEFWRDPFINFSTSDALATRGSLLLPKQLIDCIWKPDTLFQNAKAVKLYDDTAPNVFYKVVLPEGYLLRRSRYKVTAACPMHFKFYPMDSQVCSLQISLHHSRTDHVVLGWSEDFSKFTLDDSPMNFAIKILPRTKKIKLNDKVKVATETLFANFLFERSLSASLFNTYLPSLLVVCLSFVSFWLDVGAVPGRVTCGVTAILTLSTQMVQARSGLPVLDYMTALDVWLLACLIMVFLSLIEFTFAHSYCRNKKAPPEVKKEEAVVKPKGPLTAPWLREGPGGLSQTWKRPIQRVPFRPVTSKGRKMVNKVKAVLKAGFNADKDNVYDRASRVLFPLSMLLFSVLYWLLFYNAAYSRDFIKELSSP